MPCGASVRLRLRVEGDRPDAVELRVWTGQEAYWTMRSMGAYEGAWLYELTVTLPDTPCLFWYDFRIRKADACLHYGNAPDQLGGEGALWPQTPPSFQITVYDPAFAPPAWMRDAVIYQILPDRFARDESGLVLHERLPASVEAQRRLHRAWDEFPDLDLDGVTGDNRALDFFGGTLNGIRAKLPYLKTLGVTALYLNPIFYARTNHRYDTNDYRRIDPWLGDAGDFARLCQEAQAQGIRVLLDGVFSHTGADSEYFRQAQRDRSAPTFGWYRFSHWPDRYDSWWGFETLPETNELDPGFLQFIVTGNDAVVPHWLRAGADGWRLDVADELPMPFLRMLRGAVKCAKADAAIIGEVWEDASNKISYGELRSYCLGDTLDSVMNYPLRDALIAFLTGAMDAGGTARRISGLYEQYPKPFAYALMNLLGSHDRPRILNILAGVTGEDLPRAEQGKLRLGRAQRSLGLARLRLMAAFVAAWPGMPGVYYGDEAGMEGAADPFCRGTYPWGREDKALQAFFREWFAKRADHPVLRVGEAELLAPHPDVLCVVRSIENGKDALGDPAEDAAALLVIHRGVQPLTVCLSAEALSGRALIDGGGARLEPSDGLYRLELSPGSARLWCSAKG